ncbi:hypothetical protein [Flavisphingomonas formosensis]|uniref:hypothetical protein n=1 Tax=Flavisphingomonas formosensis TaxID=861534 RepID=UPI0012F7A3C1|nr:hypothetical protein [Sphingomonas formosensis]
MKQGSEGIGAAIYAGQLPRALGGSALCPFSDMLQELQSHAVLDALAPTGEKI